MACGIKRILQLKEAIQYQPLLLWDSENRPIQSECQYSWSTDGVCWTSWSSLQTYDRVCKNIEGDYFIRILLHDTFSKISVGGQITSCYSICLDQSNPFLAEFCDGENLFQPYNNLDCAIQLQMSLIHI